MLIYQTQTEGKVFQAVEIDLQALGYEVVRIKIISGRGKVIQVMLDRIDGSPLAIEDCAIASRKIAALMELNEPMDENYSLEVSSAGMDRPLTREKDFANNVNQLCKILTYQAVRGRRRFAGYITAFSDGLINFELCDTKESFEINVKNIQEANLVFYPQKNEKPNTKFKKSNDKSKR